MSAAPYPPPPQHVETAIRCPRCRTVADDGTFALMWVPGEGFSRRRCPQCNHVGPLARFRPASARLYPWWSNPLLLPLGVLVLWAALTLANVVLLFPWLWAVLAIVGGAAAWLHRMGRDRGFW